MIKDRTKKIIGLACAALFLVGCSGYWLFFSSINSVRKEVRIFIDKDDTADSVYSKIESAVLPTQMWGVRMCGLASGYESSVKPGSYVIDRVASSFSLMRKLRGGRQDAVRMVIPVTHSMNHLAARLSQQLEADSATLASAFNNESLLRKLDVTPATAACLFIPNTYEVYWDITPEKLLSRMKREYDAYWTTNRRKLAEKVGLTPNEVYTLASIVEQESANEKERPMIAGMYLNRLRQGMKLQADPTVKFALGNFSLRRILHEHLIVESPYNTYQHEGLPIGPICIPSLNAIESVLHYQSHDYLYMCAKEDFSGTHNFARTYAEHLVNARKYSDALNKRGIK